MIDFQNTYRHGVMRLDGAEDALAEAGRLLTRARDVGVPVFHVMHDAGPGSPYDIHADIGQISAEVAPAPGEPVIVKHYPSSFVQTDLDDHLRRRQRTALVLTGFMTHMCVSSTARGAFSLGYQPTVVANATATRALPGPDGTLIPATVQQAPAWPPSATSSPSWYHAPPTYPTDPHRERPVCERPHQPSTPFHPNSTHG